MNTSTPTSRAPEVHGPGSGRHHHFLNTLATVKVVAGDDASMSVVEFVAPRNFAPPPHRHLDEDELFVVLEGELIYRLGDEEIRSPQGGVAYLPAAVPHGFQVVSDMARILNVTASRTRVPQFDAFVSALGIPIPTTELPAPVEIDPGHVAEVAAAHRIELLGPPPGPLPEDVR